MVHGKSSRPVFAQSFRHLPGRGRRNGGRRGAGLLVADQLGKSARQRLGVVVLLAGLAATIPLLIGAGVRVNRELGEGRRTRRRLETIRHDSGFAEDGEFY